MLLHNQINKPLTWTADGVTYKWDPHGSCEVPDRWLVNLRSQGFPVDVTPVPPKKRAEMLADEEREAVAKSELVQLQGKLADAEARASAAAKEAETAKGREEKALAELADEKAARATLDAQLKSAQSDIAAYEKLLAEETAKREALEKQAQSAKALEQVEKTDKSEKTEKPDKPAKK